MRLTQSGTEAIAYAAMNSHTEDAVLSNAAEVYAMCGVCVASGVCRCVCVWQAVCVCVWQAVVCMLASSVCVASGVCVWQMVCGCVLCVCVCSKWQRQWQPRVSAATQHGMLATGANGGSVCVWQAV